MQGSEVKLLMRESTEWGILRQIGYSESSRDSHVRQEPLRDSNAVSREAWNV